MLRTERRVDAGRLVESCCHDQGLEEEVGRSRQRSGSEAREKWMHSSYMSKVETRLTVIEPL